MFRFFILATALAFSGVSSAAQPERNKIMVVNFELRDVSPLPNTEQEVERTEHIDTVIRNVLKEASYTLMPPCPQLAEASQQGLGYLFDRPEVAGKIGRECRSYLQILLHILVQHASKNNLSKFPSEGSFIAAGQNTD